MEDERIDRLIRELPRERASAGFTARVLARLDEGAAAAGASAGPAWAAPRFALPAFAVLVALVAATGLWVGEERERRDEERAQAALREIRAEHARLSQELRTLRETTGEPVLYLGGDEEVDLVVDLDRVRPLPASY